MKKSSIALLGLFLSAAVFAQEARLGIKGGLNVSHINSSQTEMGSRTGFHAGILSHIHLNRNWAIQPEVLYSGQGTKYTSTDGEHDLKLNYINIPLQVQYMFKNGFRLQTGPQLGLLVNAETKVNDIENDVKDSYKTPDVSWAFGASYLTNVGVGFDARYNLGLSNIYDVGNAEVRNRVWQIGLFYQFMHNPVHRRK